MKTYLDRASNLKCTITFLAVSFIAEVNFWPQPKTVDSCDLLILNNSYTMRCREISPQETPQAP